MQHRQESKSSSPRPLFPNILPKKINYAHTIPSSPDFKVIQLTPEEIVAKCPEMKGWCETLLTDDDSLSFPEEKLKLAEEIGQQSAEALSKLVICEMGTVGRGVFTLVDFPEKTTLTYYGGCFTATKNKNDNYIFTTKSKLNFTAEQYGNIARFVQHGPTKKSESQPGDMILENYTFSQIEAKNIASSNVYAVSTNISDNLEIIRFVTNKFIKAGSLVLVDYGYDYWKRIYEPFLFTPLGNIIDPKFYRYNKVCISIIFQGMDYPYTVDYEALLENFKKVDEFGFQQHGMKENKFIISKADLETEIKKNPRLFSLKFSSPTFYESKGVRYPRDAFLKDQKQLTESKPSERPLFTNRLPLKINYSETIPTKGKEFKVVQLSPEEIAAKTGMKFWCETVLVDGASTFNYSASQMAEVKRAVEGSERNLSKLVICFINPQVGHGVFPLTDLPAGEAITFYAGKVCAPNNSAFSFPFGQQSLDAENYGNISRFFQHHPISNYSQPDMRIIDYNFRGIKPEWVATANVSVKGEAEFTYFETNRPIKAFEPLGISYGLPYWLFQNISPILFDYNGAPFDHQFYSYKVIRVEIVFEGVKYDADLDREEFFKSVAVRQQYIHKVSQEVHINISKRDIEFELKKNAHALRLFFPRPSFIMNFKTGETIQNPPLDGKGYGFKLFDNHQQSSTAEFKNDSRAAMDLSS